jgi:hypothetical protein
MSNNTNIEEKKRAYKIETIKVLEKFWKMKYNIVPEGMYQKTLDYKKDMKNLIDILLEEKKREKLLKLKKIKLKQSSSIKSMEHLSPNVKTIITKIGRNYGKIRNSIANISKTNGLYLRQNAIKALDNLNSEEKNQNMEKIIEDDKYNINYYKTQRNKKFILNDVNALERKSYNNFLYSNASYRKQLNFAFLKYNPNKHLENLKLLVQTEPLIRKDVNIIKKEVDEDIKWRCDKHHFRKKYEILKKRFKRSNSVQTDPKLQLDNQNKKILPNLNTKETVKIMKILTPSFSDKKIFNIYDIKKKEEDSKIIIHKEKKLEELKNILKASSGINELIKDNNINKKIDMFKTNYDIKVKLSEYYDDNNKNLLETDYFYEEKKNIINKLGNIYEFKISNNLKEKEKENKLKEKIINDNDAFNLKLIEEKNDAINDIDENIKDNIF